MNISILASCLLYLSAFGISCLFIHLEEKNRNKVLGIIGLALPCILAGLRADSIGTDVQVYVKPIYEIAVHSSSISEFFNGQIPWGWTYKSIFQYEVAFTLVLYAVAKLLGNFQIVLFCLQALVILPIYRGLCIYKKHQRDFSIAGGMLTFYMFFFNTSLNLIRQWIAIAILIYGLGYVLNKQNIKYFCCIFFASLFHKSALLGIAVVPICYYTFLSNKVNKRHFVLGRYRFSSNMVNVCLIIACIMIALSAIDFLANILEKLGFGAYATYLGAGFTPSIKQILLRLPIFTVLIMRWRKLKQDKEIYFWIAVLLIDATLMQIAKGATYAYRIAMYFMAYNVFIYPKVFISKKSSWINKAILIIFLLLYWMYMFVYKGSDETIPYLFFWNS